MDENIGDLRLSNQTSLIEFRLTATQSRFNNENEPIQNVELDFDEKLTNEGIKNFIKIKEFIDNW